jgi:hypothetical protein
MPVHHLLEEILNEYIVAAGLQSGQPLFQSVNSLGTAVTGRALNRYNAWAAIRKRAKAAGFLTPVGCHTWRATGITIYLENDGRLEHAQQMAGHESTASGVGGAVTGKARLTSTVGVGETDSGPGNSGAARTALAPVPGLVKGVTVFSIFFAVGCADGGDG